MAYPSAPALSIGHLAEIIPDAHVGNSPPPEGSRFVALDREGGGETTSRTDNAILTVDVYERTPTRLHELTEQVRDGFKAMPAKYKASPCVTRVKVELGPIRLDDEDHPGLLRNRLQVSISVKNIRSTP